jgi:hypothetical protein
MIDNVTTMASDLPMTSPMAPKLVLPTSVPTKAAVLQSESASSYWPKSG